MTSIKPIRDFLVEYGEEIGKGSYGTVFKGVYEGEKVAIKKFSLKLNDHFQREVATVATLAHQHLVALIGILTSKEGILMELMDTSLYELVKEEKISDWTLLKKVQTAKGAVIGLAFLHENQVTHRHITSKNLLFKDGVAKLGDFASPRMLEPPLDARNIVYLAPEKYETEIGNEDFAADVYSMGLIIWEIFHARAPFDELSSVQLMAKVLGKGEREAIDESKVPRPIREVIELAWGSAEARPSASQFGDFFDNFQNAVESAQSTDDLSLYTLLEADHIFPRYQALLDEATWDFEERKNYREDLEKAARWKESALEYIETREFAMNPPLDRARLYSLLGEVTDQLLSDNICITFFTKALELRKEALGEEHQEVADTIVALAKAMCHKNRLEQGLSFFNQAKAIYGRLVGDRTSDFANIDLALGNYFFDAKKYEQAKQKYLEALRGFERCYGKDHYKAMLCLINIGMCQCFFGNLDEALRYFTDSQNMVERLYGEDHYYRSVILNKIAMTTFLRGEREQGVEISLRALEVQKKVFGEEHLEVAHSMIILGTIYSEDDDVENTEKYFKQAYMIQKKVFDQNDPVLIKTIYLRAKNFYDLEENEKSRKHFAIAAERYEAVYGKENSIVAECLFYLGLFAKKTDEDYNSAIEFLTQSLEIREKVLGPMDYAVSHNLYYLGLCQHSLKEYRSAVRNFRRALEIRRKFCEPTSIRITEIEKSEREALEALGEGCVLL